MKLIFCVTFISILCSLNIGSSTVAEELEKKQDPIDIISRSLQKRVHENSVLSSIGRFFGKHFKKLNDGKTKFTNLDPDCVFLILKLLDFDDLLSVAQINDEFSRTATDVFRRKYSHFQIVLRDSFEFPEQKKSSNLLDVFQRHKTKKTYDVYVSESGINPQISLCNYDGIIDTFKHFGHEIKKLKFWSTSEANHWKQKFMGELVSNYTSDALVDVMFEGSTGELLLHIGKPLTSVEIVRFERVNLKGIPKGFRLNDSLPSVRRLELEIHDETVDYFDCHMQHLEFVQIDYVDEIGRWVDYFLMHDVTNLFKNNPQIREAYLYGDFPEFVQKMSVLLPQLEKLTLLNVKLSNENIRFENVTHLGFYDGSIGNIHLPRLQTLYINCNSYRADFAEYLAFVNEHNQLSHLILGFSHYSDLEFKQLTANLTNLVSLDVHIEEPLVSNTIVEFLRSHDQIKRFKYSSFGIKKIIVELQNQLENEWDITFNNFFMGDLIFKRKTNNQINAFN